MGMAARGLLCLLDQVLRADEAGSSAQDHLRVGVVRLQQSLKLLLRPVIARQRLPQRLDHPDRVGVRGRQRVQLVSGLLGQLSQPLLQVLLADPAQDGVDQARCAAAGRVGRQVYSRRDRGMGRHPHPQQLVGPQAQHVKDDTVELVQPAIHALSDDGVIPALQAQRPVGQRRRESRVAAVQPRRIQHRRQDQVGEATVLTHLGQRFQTHQPRCVHRARPTAPVGAFRIRLTTLTTRAVVASGVIALAPFASLPAALRSCLGTPTRLT